MSDKDELERQSFEEWYDSNYGQFEDGEVFARKDDYYHRLGTRMCWEAWQAALSSKQEEA